MAPSESRRLVNLLYAHLLRELFAAVKAAPGHDSAVSSSLLLGIVGNAQASRRSFKGGYVLLNTVRALPESDDSTQQARLNRLKNALGGAQTLASPLIGSESEAHPRPATVTHVLNELCLGLQAVTPALFAHASDDEMQALVGILGNAVQVALREGLIQADSRLGLICFVTDSVATETSPTGQIDPMWIGDDQYAELTDVSRLALN